MTADLQQIINSSFSLQLVSALAQTLPARLGYQISEYVAGQIERQRNSKLVQAMRLNQWVITGESLNKEALDRAMHETLRYSAHFIFDLYHYIHNPDATRQLIVLDSSFQPLIERPELDQRGLVIIGLHLGSFDLVMQWLCKQGMRPLVLTIPDPHGGRRIEYEMRKKSGIHLIPASVRSFRQAVKHLQQGGMVLTGIDRPISNPRICPRFFGRPAALPIHPIFLATKAHVPLIIAGTYLQEDGKYHVFASDLIEMDSYPNEETATLRNAEKVLSIAELFIRRAPHQWCVSLLVWPEMMDFVPK